MLQRMNELAVQAANGTLTDDDKATVQQEIAQLKEEITRISEDTEFNGQKLLNGEFSYKGYTDMLGVSVNSYTKYVPVKNYTIDTLSVTRDVVDGQYVYTVDDVGFVAGTDFPDGTTVEMKDSLLTFKADSGFEITLDLAGGDFDTTNPLALDGVTIDVMGIGPMRLQIGANEGQILAVDIPATNLRNMGIENVDVSTEDGARDAITRIDGAIKYISSVRGKLGAYQNRLESTTESLDVTKENMTGAYSRLMDVDMAEEMTNYSTYQVLTQAGTSMLAQANERPAQILQLLQ